MGPDHVLEAALASLRVALTWPNPVYPVVGTLLAMSASLLPGLSGITLMALALPLTLAWDPVPVLLLFGAFAGGATFTGSVTAILLGVPGTGSNAATVADGYALARRGQARTAIACSALASALGSTLGVAALVVLIPGVRRAVLALGPLEFLLLGLLGLTTVAVVSRGSLQKGLAAAGLGCLLAFIGRDPSTAEPRFTLGLLHLRDGLGLVPLLLGLFAVTEMLDLVASRRATIAGVARPGELRGRARDGLAAVFRHFPLFLRSSAIGTLVGVVPGIGGTVAAFVAYGHAVQSARGDRGGFGRGDIRGVLAPEAANDAKDATALVPTLAFGVPGSAGTAVLLGVLAAHGIAPGRELLTGGLDLVFLLVWSLFFSNWLTSLLGLAALGPLTRLTLVRTHVLAPVVLSLVCIGVFASARRPEDVLACFLLGILGYFMKKHDWSRVAATIAFVLVPMLETNLHLSVQLHRLGRLELLERPIALGLAALVALLLLGPPLRRRRSRRESRA